MTAHSTCLGAADSQNSTNWINVIADLGRDIVSRLIFDIAFAVRFDRPPLAAPGKRSKYEDLMVAKRTVPGDARSKAAELAESISQVANQRSEAAFSALFRYFAPRIKSYCLRLGVDASGAEEITQEAMVSIWRNAGQFDPAKASPSTWIFTIARNLTIDRFRKGRRPEFDPADPSLVPDEQPSPDRLVEQSEIQERVWRIMESLSLNERNVLMLSFYENLSHGEISKQLSIPIGTVKSRIRLAFAKIRSTLDATVGVNR
jgi:RNA polymerase sigma-70 factor (ECF subfamily)